MSEIQWSALAIIKLKKQFNHSEINCLCSRVFVRYRTERYQSSGDSPEEIISNNTPNDILQQSAKVKSDVETEPVSCYCSASHTDTLSTDEHDSIKESSEGRPLLRNDSGTDVTNSGKQDIFLEWQKFWSVNGEKLIWESWIAKYSDYINPEYLNHYGDNTSQTIGENNIKPETIKPQLTKFNFDETDLRNNQKSNVKILRELSGNEDTLNNDISEGWNPLSPLSIDCDTENEQLLRPRCSSNTGSSVRTVDSMTNVTRMTVSSVDFNKSHSDSLSSVSSVESSLSTTSSEEGDEYGDEWNHLWKIHYEEEYLIQYNKFISDRDYSDTTESDSRTKQSKRNSYLARHNLDLQKSNKSCSESNTIENIFSKMEMNTQSSENSDLSEKEESVCDEKAQMIALGLPSSFGKHEDDCSDGSTGKPKKTRLDNSAFNSSRNKIKAAFTLLGIEFTDNKDDLMGGNVEYKMKHIRSQNRTLKFRGENRPKHTYFDDDGNPIQDKNEEENRQGILSDCSENKVSSAEEDATTTEQTIKPIQNEEGVIIVSKRRKRRRKLNIPPEIKANPKLKKYWLRRFSLFYRFDEGIKLDEESWYSVTPELIAKHTAERCKTNIIIDAFCGAGGNAIQFASTCKKVIAIDIDPKKIELAKNNAAVYGVEDKIEFVVGDYLSLAPDLKADTVFLSPPWGGPSYVHSATYDLETMLQPVPFSKLLEVTRNISSNIAVFLPKNSNTYDVMKHTGEKKFAEIEQNFINNNLIGITVYYNDLIKKLEK